MPDALLVFEGAGGARLAVCRADEVAREAARRHGLAPGSAATLAQALAGALLLAGSDPDQSRVDVHLTCPGPVLAVLTDADARGSARGFVRATDLEIDGKPARESRGDRIPAEAARFDARPLLATRHDEVAGSLSIVRAAEGSADLHRTAFPFAGAD